TAPSSIPGKIASAVRATPLRLPPIKIPCSGSRGTAHCAVPPELLVDHIQLPPRSRPWAQARFQKNQHRKKDQSNFGCHFAGESHELFRPTVAGEKNCSERRNPPALPNRTEESAAPP